MYGLVSWIVVGLIAGFLTGKIMKGQGYGLLLDTVLGMAGAIVGGWVFGVLGIYTTGGLVPSIIVATFGAILLTWVARKLKKA